MKPEKYTLKETFINPVVAFSKEVFYIFIKEILGFWYCDYCKKYHGPRAKSYSEIISACTYKTYCTLARNKEV